LKIKFAETLECNSQYYVLTAARHAENRVPILIAPCGCTHVKLNELFPFQVKSHSPLSMHFLCRIHLYLNYEFKVN